VTLSEVGLLDGLGRKFGNKNPLVSEAIRGSWYIQFISVEQLRILMMSAACT